MNKFKIGDKVHYQPKHFAEDEFENGIVKNIPRHMPSVVKVVYHCNDNWHDFKEYTAASTNICDLKIGWK